VEDRALGHARLAGDVAHRHRLDAALGEQLPRGLEHAPAVAGGVSTFAGPALVGVRQLHAIDRSTNLTAVKFVLT
jgi:hypothetical protein